MSTTAAQRIRFRVEGRVQGVSFRYSARHEALGLGLRGWVRNLPDGDVEGLVEGSPDDVGRFLAWCAHGPPGARVDRLERESDSSAGELRPFEIRR